MAIELFFDRPALAMAVRAMRAARRSIDVETFMVGGRLGRAVLRLLDRKAAAGVRVRLLHREGPTIRAAAACKRWLPLVRGSRAEDHPDHHYTPEVDRLFRGPLAGSLIERAAFPLQAFRGRGFAPLKLAHDKIIVIDGHTAILGGMNLATAVSRNCDLLMKLTGSAAAAPAAVFDYDWELSMGGNPAFPSWTAEWRPSDEAAGSAARSRLVVTRPGRANQRRAVRELIGSARCRAWVQMFYLTEPTIVDRLIAARRRGVDVRVLCDANECSLGVRLHGAPNLPFVQDLIEGGVAVRLYHSRPGSQMHQKSIVIDSRLVYAGATNLTRQSFRVNTESALIADDPALGQVLDARFARCWSDRSSAPDAGVFQRRRHYLGAVRTLSRFI